MKSFLLVLFSAFLFQNTSISSADVLVKNSQQDAPLMKQERGVMIISHGSSTTKRHVVKEKAQKTIELEKQRQIVKQQNNIERKQKQEEIQKTINSLDNNSTTQQQIASNVAQFANQPLITGLDDKEQNSIFTDALDIIKLVMGTYNDLYNDNIKQGSAPASPHVVGAYRKMYNILDKFSQFVNRDENKNVKK